MSLKTLNEQETNLLIDCGLTWQRIGLSTKPVDMQRAVKAIRKAYKYAGLLQPRVFLGPFNNPIECAKIQALVKRLPENIDVETLQNLKVEKDDAFTEQELLECLNEQLYGCMDADWICSFDYINKLTNNALIEVEGLVEVTQECGWWAAYENIVFIQDRPLEIHLNDKGELHNENGPAIKWRDDDRSLDIYAVDGKVSNLNNPP